jgi:hypothetical protein
MRECGSILAIVFDEIRVCKWIIQQFILPLHWVFSSTWSQLTVKAVNKKFNVSPHRYFQEISSNKALGQDQELFLDSPFHLSFINQSFYDFLYLRLYAHLLLFVVYMKIDHLPSYSQYTYHAIVERHLSEQVLSLLSEG